MAANSTLEATHTDSNSGLAFDSRTAGLFPFPRPDIGHICESCQGIPIEILQVGSNLFSNKCKAHHGQESNCKGDHPIFCDHCNRQFQGEHYHCGICHDDNFDLCQACKMADTTCHDSKHEMAKRIFRDGLIREVHTDDSSNLHPGVTEAMIARGMQPYLLHNKLSGLIASAEAGCHSCSVLLGRLQLQDSSVIDDNLLDTAVYLENRPLQPPEDARFASRMLNAMDVEPDLDVEADDGLPVTMLAVRIERDAENPQVEDPERDRLVCHLSFELRGPHRILRSRHASWVSGTECRQISPIVDAGDNLKVIGTWLDSCLSGESECSTWPRENFQPTRLIYVGPDDSNNHSLCLITSATITEIFPAYVTLSYCWGMTGQETRWMLTKENLSAFERAIPADALPKTIADAVKVARSNNIHYLWVDSLCIVQDDPDEWKYEAYRMCQVYNSSLFTIISGSDSATGGLFLPREQLKVSAAEVPLSSDDPSQKQLAVLYPLIRNIEMRPRDGPTSTRAWCYQEELLSVRRLYFTDAQFIWECQCSTHSEAGKRTPGDHRSSSLVEPRYDAEVLLRSSQIFGEWYRIVEEYTSRQLTYHGDLFAALAGVAASLKTRYECRYLAGMWENDTMNGLLWQRIGNTLARPTEFDAPSWSWLSVKGQVAFARGDSPSSEPDAEFIDCDVKTNNGDDFGVVEPGATLRLRARCLPCAITHDVKGHELEKLGNVYQQPPEEITSLPGHERQSPERNSVADDEDMPDVDEANENKQGADEREESGKKPRYVLRKQAWEAPQHLDMTPPGGRLDLCARVKLRGTEDNREFATLFFDGEEEAKTTEFLVAYIGATERPYSTTDRRRNGIALAPVPVAYGTEAGGVNTYRRIGFVAFWDKLIKEDLEFLYGVEKMELSLV